MAYQDIIKFCDDTQYMISMISMQGIIKTGLAMELNETSTVLDLCCGYGTMLKVWAETFGIQGKGVDIHAPFIQEGERRNALAGVTNVTLVADDVLQYESAERYDVVCCSESLGDMEQTLTLMEKFIRPGGRLVKCSLFSTVPNPPQELIDFDGPLETLDAIYDRFRGLGYYVTNIAGDDRFTWDHYISWSAKRDITALRKNPEDAKLRAWIEKWYHMYFKYRREYEGMAMFVLERI